MYKQISILTLLTCTIVFFSSCSDDSKKTYDCTFVQDDSTKDGEIDETERSIMNECLNNPLNSMEDIEKNIIGEWELVGHGEGWIFTVSQPCAYLTISEQDVTVSYQDASLDTTIVSNWELSTTSSTFPNNIRLAIEGSYPINFSFRTFCEDYMYNDATPVDGNMYLFEKVN